MSLRTSDAQPVLTFAPQTLCWAHQRDQRDTSMVTIQGYDDCYYLDLAEYAQSDDRLFFRYTGVKTATTGSCRSYN